VKAGLVSVFGESTMWRWRLNGHEGRDFGLKEDAMHELNGIAAACGAEIKWVEQE